MPDMGISLGQQITAVKREIALRERVYPQWVKSGRMKQHNAEIEIANMKAVLHTLMDLERSRAEADALFGEDA